MLSNIKPILLIEDNIDDYEATSRSFKKNNFMNKLIWCKNGQNALDYLNDEENDLPSIIFLDLNMPGIHGSTVLEAIKKDERLNNIPIIILTTSSDPMDIDKCYKLGASTYIQKPVSVESLTQTLGTLKNYWFGVALLPDEQMTQPVKP